jgi:hypothetical protein
MKVYRVELPCGGGPFRSATCAFVGVGKNNHPYPDDEGIDFEYKHVFGCQSLRDIYGWFGHRIPHLMDNGFAISVYDVKKARVGGTQVAFDRKHAKLKKRISLSKMAKVKYIREYLDRGIVKNVA